MILNATEIVRENLDKYCKKIIVEYTSEDKKKKEVIIINKTDANRWNTKIFSNDSYSEYEERSLEEIIIFIAKLLKQFFEIESKENSIKFEYLDGRSKYIYFA